MEAAQQERGSSSSGSHGGGEHKEPQHGPDVPIEVNDKPVSIHRGRRSVAELKNAGGVPLAHDLEQLVDGKLTPLPDDGTVVIKGGEEFFSHPKDSGSS